MFFPSTAALIQHKIGATRAWGFDLAGACSGFTFALATASQLVSTGRHSHALVVGADVMSSIIDYKDRATCVLFGDGAGAVVVSVANDPALAILDFAHEIDGAGGQFLKMPAGGSLRPATHETVEQRLHFVKQDGQAVFKFAVRKTEEITRVIMQRNNLSADDIALFVSHQANRRIITAAADRLGHRRVEGRHQPRAVRQHHGRHHPARTQRLRPGWPPEEGRPGHPRLGRSRVYRRRRPAALGHLSVAGSIR